MRDFEQKLVDSWPPEQWQDLRVLLAVSGGSDSMAMLRSMVTLHPEGSPLLQAAHFNHGLRGTDSDADQAFVEGVCHRLGIECLVGRAGTDGFPPIGKNGLEASARGARYAFLQTTAERVGARYVVTAHTADDQVETILHHIIRGTGIGGLAGMARARRLGGGVALIRPFLGFQRHELRGYLADLGQSFREDASNADIDMTRNRIRHELLPMLADRFNPSVDKALLQLGLLAGELQSIVARLVERLYEESVHCDTDGVTVYIDTVALNGEPSYLVRELLMEVWRRSGWSMQAMGFKEWSILSEMLVKTSTIPTHSTHTTSRTFPGNVAAVLEAGMLRLFR